MADVPVPLGAAGADPMTGAAATPLLVVAGEASGDQHAARLIAELRRLRPDVAPFGMGGGELAAQGVELLADSAEVAVVGITEVLKVLPRARQVFRQLVAECERRRPPVAVLVDFPDFNLRLVRELERRDIAVAYYVSPQVWAWRRRRVRTIARSVDRMLVLFPFEVAFYRRHGVSVDHVGHPLVDDVPELPQAWDSGPPAGAEPYRVALLPGSRRSEVAALLPAMLAAVERLGRQVPVEATLVRAQTVPPRLIEEHLARVAAAVQVVPSERRFATVANSHLALCASGTATLEVGLLRTPLIVLYRLQVWSYLLARLLVRLPYFSLANLVLGEKVVPELLQAQASPEIIAAEAASLLRDDPRREAVRDKLATLRSRLGEGGGSRRAAEAVAELLTAREAAA